MPQTSNPTTEDSSTQPIEPLAEDLVKEICDEIESQWEYHVMTRAVFTANFRHATDSFESPSFYRHRGIVFQIGMPKDRSPQFLRAQHGIAYWHNQNFVIRLFGILDAHKITKQGIIDNIQYIRLLKILRNNVGAHSSGRRPSNETTLRQATRIINKLYDKNVNIETVSEYAIALDRVLEPLKNQVIEYVKSLSKTTNDGCEINH